MDSISLILKELRLMKKEMASNKAEFEEKLAEITHKIRSAADQDTASSARTASKETIDAWTLGPQRLSRRQVRQN
jgi:hypothetical protein